MPPEIYKLCCFDDCFSVKIYKALAIDGGVSRWRRLAAEALNAIIEFLMDAVGYQNEGSAVRFKYIQYFTHLTFGKMRRN